MKKIVIVGGGASGMMAERKNFPGNALQSGGTLIRRIYLERKFCLPGTDDVISPIR